jgi:hypothetical protein
MPESIWNSPLVSSRVETLDHTKGWAKQKETISADPDGLTFSHYKAGAIDDLIAQFDATLRSLPYQHGFTPAEGGLKATGGALVPEKSYWYLIDFVWTGERWPYAMKEDTPGDISINNVNDIGRARLHRYEASEAQKTLGVFLAMDGNNMEETRYLRQKAVDFADCVRTGFLSRQDATYALHCTIMKTLEYLMVATTMNKLQ